MGQSQSFAIDWSHIAADSGAGVLVIDASGRVLFINPVAAALYARRPPRDATGARLADLLPAPAAAERLDLIRSAISSSAPAHARDLWSGWALRWTVHPLNNPADPASPHALVVIALDRGLEDAFPELASPHARAVEFRHIDLGPLASLTASELKVMALISEGLSNAEIAARLHRAVKTVESHRAALSEKTGATSRVQLGFMARRAGLMRRVVLSDHETPARAPRI